MFLKLQMQNRKQKNIRKRLSTQSRQKIHPLLRQMRKPINSQFEFKEIQTFKTFEDHDFEAMKNVNLKKSQLTDLISNSLKLEFIYECFLEELEVVHPIYLSQIPIKTALRIFQRGQFYKYFPSDNLLTILINNRSTKANTHIIVASLLCFSSKKLSISEIEQILLIFGFESNLTDFKGYGFPLQIIKISRLLKKLDRILPNEKIRQFIECIRASNPNCSYLEPYHFLYLCSISQNHQNSSSLSNFIEKRRQRKNLQQLKQSKDLQIFEGDNEQTIKQEDQQNREIVRGLSLSEPNTLCKNFSKEITRGVRFCENGRNRPNSSYLRSYISHHVKDEKQKSSLKKKSQFYSCKKNKQKLFSQICQRFSKTSLNKLRLNKKQNRKE